MKKDILFVILVLCLGYLGIKYSGKGQDDSLLLNKQKQVKARRRALESLSSVKVAGGNENDTLRSSTIDAITVHPDAVKLPNVRYEKEASDTGNRRLEDGHTTESSLNPESEFDERGWQFRFGQWKGYFASAVSLSTEVVDVNSVSQCVISVIWREKEKQLVRLSDLTHSDLKNNDLVLAVEDEDVLRFTGLREISGFALATNELIEYCQSVGDDAVKLKDASGGT